MELNDDDKKLLEILGLQNISDEEKKVVLDEIDTKMSQRFIANLLSTMSDDQAKKLQEEVDALQTNEPEKIIEKIITTHPDAESVLEKTSQEIIDEFKQARIDKPENASGQNQLGDIDSRPPIEQAAPKEPDLASSSVLSQPSTSELDKSIDSAPASGNVMPNDTTTSVPPTAPEPPQTPDFSLPEKPITPTPDAAQSASSQIAEPPSEQPKIEEPVATPTPQEDRPLDFSFSADADTTSAEVNSAVNTNQSSEPAAISAPESPAPTVSAPPAAGEPAPEITAMPDADSPEPITPAPASELASQQPGDNNSTQSPAENPAPWSFSSSPSSQETQAATEIPGEAAPAPAPIDTSTPPTATFDTATDSTVTPTSVTAPSTATAPQPPVTAPEPPQAAPIAQNQASSSSIADLYK